MSNYTPKPKSHSDRTIIYTNPTTGKRRIFVVAQTGPCECGGIGKLQSRSSNSCYICDKCKERTTKGLGRHKAYSKLSSHDSNHYVEGDGGCGLTTYKAHVKMLSNNVPMNWSCYR